MTDERRQTGQVEREDWTLVIRPKSKLFNVSLKELWQYRDLIGLFVRRDFVVVYKQTILGPLWFLLQPLMNTLVYTVVFGNLAHLSADGLPRILFYFSGTMLWQYFANCISRTADTFTGNASIFGKVYFPRLTVPISIVVSNLVTFGIQLGLFLLILLYFLLTGSPVHPNVWILSLPLVMLSMAALGLGFGVIVASLTIKYRDLKQLVLFGVQLWMYITPIVYPLSQVPSKWRWIVMLNPVSAPIEVFRYSFTGAGTVQWSYLTLSAAVTVLVLAIGVLLFNRVERSFMDVV